MLTDRLGSVRYHEDRGRITYYPYGEIRSEQYPNPSPPAMYARPLYGTYTRDHDTNLDYADQRYYASTYARFLTPDPYQASAGPSEPGSWNRYAYVEGDPVNFGDPSGLCRESVSLTAFYTNGTAQNYSHTTVCGDPGVLVVGGSSGWNSKTESETNIGNQADYESGSCVTPDGRPCYEADLEKRKLHEYLECLAPKLQNADTMLKNYIQGMWGPPSDLLVDMGKAAIVGAATGAGVGAVAGTPTIVGVPFTAASGAVVGGLAGVIAVPLSKAIMMPIRYMAFVQMHYAPAVAKAFSHCDDIRPANIAKP